MLRTQVSVTGFSAINVGCIKNAGAQLTALHAFIGPNDSGKSTFLRSIQFLIDVASQRASPPPPLREGTEIWATFSTRFSYQLKYHGTQWQWSATGHAWSSGLLDTTVPLERFTYAEVVEVLRWLRGARLVRLDTDMLRRQTRFLPPEQVNSFFENRGLGLAAIYDLILKRGDDSYRDLSERVRGLFTTVKRIGVRPVSDYEQAIEIELRDGTVVPAAQVSDGLLYFLAFAAIPYIAPCSVLLVEEPENGLHPARIAEVMATLRAISETGTQVLIATHNPLVVNELKPEEVSIVTRTLEEGTQIKAIKDIPDFDRKSKIYALGELWLSYANGVDEGPLLSGPAPLDSASK